MSDVSLAVRTASGSPEVAEPKMPWRLVVLQGGSSLPSRILTTGLVLGGTVIGVEYCARGYAAGTLVGPLLVWLCMGLAGIQLAWYLLLAKLELNNKSVWGGRDEAFTALVIGGCSLLLFLITVLTGGPAVATYAMSWNEGFIVPAIGSGILNIGIMVAKIKAKAREDLSLVAPIESSTPAIVILFGIFFLGEMPGVWGWTGIWLLALGTYTLGIRDLFDKLAVSRKAQQASTLETLVGEQRSGWRYQAAVWLAPIISLKQSVGVRWAYVAVLLSLVALNYEALSTRNANVAFAYACVFGIAAAGNLLLALYWKEFRGLDWHHALRALLLMAALFAALHVSFGL
jgi:uncharacterized membrane protein